MKSDFFINGYGIYSSISDNYMEFKDSIFNSRSNLSPLDRTYWNSKTNLFWDETNSTASACTIQDSKEENICKTLAARLFKVTQEATDINDLNNTKSLGIIFASTKGSIEDYIWDENSDLNQFPLKNVLDQFLVLLNLTKPSLNICVSNACASSHAALYEARSLLSSKQCTKVLVIATDFIGPFISTGFKSLRALSNGYSKPFSIDRSGLMLGEAACALVVSNEKSIYKISDVDIYNEGYAVTSPSEDGRGILTCIKNVLKKNPDMAIAHGTGTLLNDKVEDHVFARLKNELGYEFDITCTKWATGHTLGASGLVDLIAGIACFEKQEVFPIKHLETLEHLETKTYVQNKKKKIIKDILVLSLGFGGTNSALLLTKVGA